MLSAERIKSDRALIRGLSLKPLAKGRTLREEERRLLTLWRDFVPDEPAGKQLYESYTDEELTEILKEAFIRLGHAPAQSDIFYFYRTYIKHRFVTWNAALKAAGLSRALDTGAGNLTTEEYEKIEKTEPKIRALLIRLSERRTELGYPPGRKEFPKSEALKRRFGSWSAALNAAEGFDKYQQSLQEDFLLFVTLEEEAFLQELKDTAEKLGRTPLRTEIREETRCRLRICCGSWNYALRQAGLAPLDGSALKQAQCALSD